MSGRNSNALEWRAKTEALTRAPGESVGAHGERLRDALAPLIEGVRTRGTTVLLVTHFMEEAERLCDRVAVIDAGRVVALDTPAALAAGADAEQRIRFRPASPLDDQLLRELPDVISVQRHGEIVTVTGSNNVVNAVTSVLASHGIVAEQLRVDQASLEDAFVALTGRHETSLREAGLTTESHGRN